MAFEVLKTVRTETTDSEKGHKIMIPKVLERAENKNIALFNWKVNEKLSINILGLSEIHLTQLARQLSGDPTYGYFLATTMRHSTRRLHET